jgi:hypothetical protein
MMKDFTKELVERIRLDTLRQVLPPSRPLVEGHVKEIAIRENFPYKSGRDYVLEKAKEIWGIDLTN